MENSEYENMVKRIRPALLVMCRSFFSASNMTDESEDVTQETFLRMWHERQRLSTEMNPDALAIRIAKNLCVDRFRKVNTQSRLFEMRKEELADSPETKVIESESLDCVLSLMERLPASQRRMLAMKADGMTLDEIAAICGTSKNCVKSQISSARRKLISNIKNRR